MMILTYWLSNSLDKIIHKFRLPNAAAEATPHRVKLYSDPPLLETNLSSRLCHRPPPPMPVPNFHCSLCECSLHSTEAMIAHRCVPSV